MHLRASTIYYALFIGAFFATLGFFNYHQMLTEPMIKAIFYGLSALAILLALTDRNVRVRDTSAPRLSYSILMLMLCVSPVMAYIFHGQGIMPSVITSLAITFSYAWFYVLLKFRIPTDRVIKVLFIACALAIPVYALNAMAFPSAIFGEAPEEDITRGIVRITVPFIITFVLLLFYSINKWNKTRRPVWIAVISIISLMIIMSVIRQIILVAGLLGVLFIFRSLSWVKKALGIAVLLAVVFFVLPQIPMYQAMMELSEKQFESNEMEEEDVRIGSWRYHIYEYQDSPMTMLLGNGMPSVGNSAWGDKFDYDAETSRYFAADVGWAGFFYHFGAIATAALAMLFWNAFRHKKSDEKQYLNYWLAFIAITAVASGPILYFYQIFEVVTGLYLVYASEHEDNSPYHTQLQ